MEQVLNLIGGKRFLLFTGSQIAYIKQEEISLTLALNKANVTNLKLSKYQDKYLMKFSSDVNNIERIVKADEIEKTFTSITGLYTKFC